MHLSTWSVQSRGTLKAFVCSGLHHRYCCWMMYQVARHDKDMTWYDIMIWFKMISCGQNVEVIHIQTYRLFHRDRCRMCSNVEASLCPMRRQKKTTRWTLTQRPKSLRTVLIWHTFCSCKQGRLLVKLFETSSVWIGILLWVLHTFVSLCYHYHRFSLAEHGKRL